MLLLVQSYALDEASYKLYEADAKIACINLLKFGYFSYWFDKPWFHTEGRLADVLITPSLGVSNWAVIYKTSTSTPHHQSSTFFSSDQHHDSRATHCLRVTGISPPSIAHQIKQ
jgi:hypothetical protein